MKKVICVIDMLNGFTKIGPLSSDLIKNIIPNIENYLNINKKIENTALRKNASIMADIKFPNPNTGPVAISKSPSPSPTDLMLIRLIATIKSPGARLRRILNMLSSSANTDIIE